MPKTFLKYLIGALLLCGCYSAHKNEDGVFLYNEQSGIASLDPAFAKNQSIIWAVHQLYNTLVEVDSNLTIKPSLATSWTVSADKKIYRFVLRSDVKFHDHPAFTGGKGRTMVAADVVYSLHRILDKSIASPGAWIFRDKVDSVQPFVAVNDTTVDVRLQRPYPPILGILSMQYCSIVPKEVVAATGTQFRRQPVGTGPFQFVAWDEGGALILKKNPAYFERDAAGTRLPYLNGVKVSFYDSKATEFLLFRQGKLHFMNDIDASFKDEVLTKKGTLRPEWQGKIQLNKHPYLNIEYLGILVDSNNALLQQAPTKMKAVRQAINYGFDREKMMLYLRNSIGKPANAGFVPMGLPSFNADKVKGYLYKPEESRRLLRNAGFDGVRNRPKITLHTIPLYADLAAYIARALSEVGFDVRVEAVQKSLLLEMTSNSRALFFRGSWIADYPDAENYLSVFYSKNPAPPNYTRYHSPKFDALFEQALTETSDSLRYRLYQQADSVMMQGARLRPLWYHEALHLVQPSVQGFKPNALNLLELRYTTINN